MRTIVLVLTIFIVSCSSRLYGGSPISTEFQNQPELTGMSISDAGKGRDISWGFYDVKIQRDGSGGGIVPSRSSNDYLYTWGYHINALKFLEGGQCTNCVSASNIHPTIDGNVSVDVSITHPFHDARYTGFDVRGIVMFPWTQQIPDDDLRALVGMEPYAGSGALWYSEPEKGGADLVNKEGLTRFWNPTGNFFLHTEEGPAFEYYEGKFASADSESIGNLNPFIRFNSNENRHMFEVNKTVTRTFIIKPPAEGEIEFCYAVYAHWAEPDVIPVNDPASDFPKDANSVLPYELNFWQDGIIDPDAPEELNAEKIHIHLKHWGVIPDLPEVFDWTMSQSDYIWSNYSPNLRPHPNGIPDEYCPYFFAPGYYVNLPGAFPGKFKYVFRIDIRDPDPFNYIGTVGRDYWIMEIEMGELDGQW